MNEWTWQFQRGGEENASLVSFKFHSLCCCSVHVKRKINLHKLIRWIKRLLMLLQHLMVLSLCLSSHNLPFPSSHLNPFTTNWKLWCRRRRRTRDQNAPSAQRRQRSCAQYTNYSAITQLHLNWQFWRLHCVVPLSPKCGTGGLWDFHFHD